MIVGRPISSSASSAAPSVLTWCERGVERPILVIASRKRSRSSALSIASAVAPIISTSNFSRMHAHLLQRKGAVERGLAAHGRQQREAAGQDVAFLLDDLGDDLWRDRLDIGRVGQLRIGHDRRRVRVDQDDAIALCLQRLAGLGAGIVELAGLADDDRARADDQDRLDVCALGHGLDRFRAGAHGPSDRKERRPASAQR
jgi:hypothetical protein